MSQPSNLSYNSLSSEIKTSIASTPFKASDSKLGMYIVVNKLAYGINFKSSQEWSSIILASGATVN